MRRFLRLAALTLTGAALVAGPARAAVLPPAPEVPPIVLPPEVEPVAALAGPIASAPCGALALGTVVVALGGGSVPPEVRDLVFEAIPYAGAAFVACGSIPYPERFSQCDADAQALSGLANVPGAALLPVPKPAATLVDELHAVDRFVDGANGDTGSPGIATNVNDQLGCELQ